MKRIFILLFAVASYSAVFAQEKGREKKYINPEGLLKSPNYTHVVISGGTVYISGQVSANEKGEVIGKGDLRTQMNRVYENIRTCLTAAGITFDDVIKLNTYVVNLKQEDLTVIREVRKSFMTGQNPPASTLVGVTALANPDFLVEVEVVARLR